MRKPRASPLAASSEWRGSEVSKKLIAIDGANGVVDILVDVFADKADVAVGQEEVSAACVTTTEVIKVC